IVAGCLKEAGQAADCWRKRGAIRWRAGSPVRPGCPVIHLAKALRPNADSRAHWVTTAEPIARVMRKPHDELHAHDRRHWFSEPCVAQWRGDPPAPMSLTTHPLRRLAKGLRTSPAICLQPGSRLGNRNGPRERLVDLTPVGAIQHADGIDEGLER